MAGCGRINGPSGVTVTPSRMNAEVIATKPLKNLCLLFQCIYCYSCNYIYTKIHYVLKLNLIFFYCKVNKPNSVCLFLLIKEAFPSF